VSADASSVARNLLSNQVKQMGANYTLLSNTVVIGHPVIQGVDRASGKVSLKIAASGDAVYAFPDAQVQSIRNSIKGKTVSNAQKFLASQPGVDPKTVAIHFTQGSSNTLPDNIQDIKIVPLNAGSYPPVQLKPVSSPSGNTTTPNATNTPTVTATQDNN
ncbi:MAG TPA: hypothetical protein VJO32_11295, partial [Ktedonobacteraceae bacterium]|nr:hypothetical protein [Ktedonobacteraceae bacterium]